MSPCFQRVLLEVFLSGMILDVGVTLQFLEKANILNEFFTTLTAISKKFMLSYERKLFVLAISNMLFNGQNLPQIIKDSAGFFL